MLLRDAAARRHLADAEDDEFRRLDGSKTDFHDELASVDDLGRVGFRVALDKEALLRRLAHERPVPMEEREERADGPGDALPEPVVVRLEDHPLGGALDRRLHHDEEAADVDVTPRGIRRQGAGAPNPDAAAEHQADAVDTLRVEEILLTLRHVVAEAEGAANDL